jgi:hypothetical protein
MTKSTTMREQLEKVYPKHKKEKKLSPSCLNIHNRILRIRPDRKDGVDHINISTSGATKLGRKLSPEFKFTFQCTFGSFISLEVFMAYINTPDFPEYLFKPIRGRSVSKELSKLKLKRIRLPNYWTIVIDGMWQRLVQDPGLMERLAKSELPFTSYHIRKSEPQAGSLVVATGSKELEVIVHHNNMGRYIGVWEEFRKILKASDDPVERKKAASKLILESRDEPDKHIFSDVPFISTDGLKEITDKDIERFGEEKDVDDETQVTNDENVEETAESPEIETKISEPVAVESTEETTDDVISQESPNE